MSKQTVFVSMFDPILSGIYSRFYQHSLLKIALFSLQPVFLHAPNIISCFTCDAINSFMKSDTYVI